MELLQTSHIYNWPENVLIGAADISGDHPSAILSETERKEYDSFNNPKRKAEYLTARHLFNFILRQAETDPDTVELLKHEGGKPFVEDSRGKGFVSFSHTADMVFCAYSRDKDIGVDVEKSDREIKNGVLRRILNEEERLSLENEAPVILWTVKEAVVKCMGTGLRTNLNELTILKNDKNQFSVSFNNEKMFEICSFRQLNHQIALAY